MDYGVLFSTLMLLFMAELGDKSQLVVMTLAHRHRATPVIIGTFAAFTLLNLLAVLVGEGLASLVPREIVLSLAGVLFLAFAYRTWRSSEDAGEETVNLLHRQVWLTSFILIFVAEFGDKTQLAMVALAAQSGAPWSVFVGGTAALFAVSLLGVWVGSTLLQRISRRRVKQAAAIAFLVFGLLALGQATRLLGAVQAPG